MNSESIQFSVSLGIQTDERFPKQSKGFVELFKGFLEQENWILHENNKTISHYVNEKMHT